MRPWTSGDTMSHAGAMTLARRTPSDLTGHLIKDLDPGKNLGDNAPKLRAGER